MPQKRRSKGQGNQLAFARRQKTASLFKPRPASAPGGPNLVGGAIVASPAARVKLGRPPGSCDKTGRKRRSQVELLTPVPSPLDGILDSKRAKKAVVRFTPQDKLRTRDRQHDPFRSHIDKPRELAKELRKQASDLLSKINLQDEQGCQKLWALLQQQDRNEAELDKTITLLNTRDQELDEIHDLYKKVAELEKQLELKDHLIAQLQCSNSQPR